MHKCPSPCCSPMSSSVPLSIPAKKTPDAKWSFPPRATISGATAARGLRQTPLGLPEPTGSGCPARRDLLVMGSMSMSRRCPGPGKGTLVSIWIPFGILYPASQSGLDHVCSCPGPRCLPRGQLARTTFFFFDFFFFSLFVAIKKKKVKQSQASRGCCLDPSAKSDPVGSSLSGWTVHVWRAASLSGHPQGPHPSPGIPRGCIPHLASPGTTSFSWHLQGLHPSPGILLLVSPGAASLSWHPTPGISRGCIPLLASFSWQPQGPHRSPGTASFSWQPRGPHPSPGISRGCISPPGTASLSQQPQGPHPSPGISRGCISPPGTASLSQQPQGPHPSPGIPRAGAGKPAMG
ncbi:uncharacterized protein LOC128917094 [Rissa tridactyla]|uniref:uncharacterized protein LOC128917094 n=1 Tax=Rissa tridactyla TaxID=75485 RepID=UPI0023BAABED|nr:uncharacterized protein LOC128917094 [Rissa tridactyla]